MRARNDATLQALRLKYNAALDAHSGCLRALTDATLAGATVPSAALLEAEAKARQELDRARDRLLAALTEAITGQPPPAAASGREAELPRHGTANFPPDAT
jgi:hypothetical protein